jgi:hypothetical protein
VDDERLSRAIAAIDAANAGDPVTISIGGEARPKEQAHAELMTAWVQRLDPAASDAQLLAARAHHLRRWVVPRSDYPDGRAGYLRWRTAQQRRQATEVAGLLTDAGYDGATVAEVQRLIRKEGLRREPDPAVQAHEDALCLVFLETQLDELTDRLGADKTVEVLAKTLVKMSHRGIEAALALPLTEPQRTLIERAVAHDLRSNSDPDGAEESTP